MANLNKIEIELKDIKLVKNLVELLEIHFDELPKQLQCQLKSISETGLNDIEANDIISSISNYDFNKVESSHLKNIISINKVLQKVKYSDIGGNICTIYPEHFYLKYDGKTIIEW